MENHLPPLSPQRPPFPSQPYGIQYTPRKNRTWIWILIGTLILIIGLCSCTGLVSIIARWQYSQTQTVTTPVEPEISLDGVYTVVGQPSINVEFINEVLAEYDSPAQGKGQALYDYGQQYNIDPAYALAFFMQESSFGTRGVATVTHSLGNIRTTPGYDDYNGYRRYASWEEGFLDWYKLIHELYITKWDLTTVDDIIPVYAPAHDNNNEEQYIHAVKLAVTKWRMGMVRI